LLLVLPSSPAIDDQIADEPSVLKGHEFIRAEMRAKWMRAFQPPRDASSIVFSLKCPGIFLVLWRETVHPGVQLFLPCVRARLLAVPLNAAEICGLYSPRKNSQLSSFVSGHGFSRANNLLRMSGL
jgi:hypothetical protein